MRQTHMLAAAVAAAVCLGGPAAAQKKPAAPPAQAKAAAGKAAPGAPVVAPPIDIDRVAAAAGLAAANKAQVAPHMALMNQQLIEMRQLTAHARKDAPKAEQDRMHKDLAAYYAVFKQHWDAARALVPPAKQPAFDAAIRTEMSGGRRVGNPHPTMPPTHPKMNPHTGKPIK